MAYPLASNQAVLQLTQPGHYAIRVSGRVVDQIVLRGQGDGAAEIYARNLPVTPGETLHIYVGGTPFGWGSRSGADDEVMAYINGGVGRPEWGPVEFHAIQPIPDNWIDDNTGTLPGDPSPRVARFAIGGGYNGGGNGWFVAYVQLDLSGTWVNTSGNAEATAGAGATDLRRGGTSTLNRVAVSGGQGAVGGLPGLSGYSGTTAATHWFVANRDPRTFLGDDLNRSPASASALSDALEETGTLIMPIHKRDVTTGWTRTYVGVTGEAYMGAQGPTIERSAPYPDDARVDYILVPGSGGGGWYGGGSGNAYQWIGGPDPDFPFYYEPPDDDSYVIPTPGNWGTNHADPKLKFHLAGWFQVPDPPGFTSQDVRAEPTLANGDQFVSVSPTDPPPISGGAGQSASCQIIFRAGGGPFIGIIGPQP